MGKPFEVKEFDSIICNADYKDDEKYKYLNQKEFDNLVAFIHEFTGDADSADALDFMKIGYRRNVGEVVSIKNYVGLIQMKNGFQIQVLPKISFGAEDEGNVQTKRVFLRMLRSMKDFPSKVFNDASIWWNGCCLILILNRCMKLRKNHTWKMKVMISIFD